MDTIAEKVKLRCPVCGKKLSCTPDKIGRMARCPHCGDTVRVAAPGLTTPAPPTGADLEAEFELESEPEPAEGPPPRRTEPAEWNVPETHYTGGSSLVWKALFFSVAPMALLLGAFLGYALRPPTPEQMVEDAQQQSDEILEQARQQAEQTIARAEQNAAALTPRARPATGQDAASRMVRARNYLPRLVITDAEIGRSALGVSALVGRVQNTGDRTVQMVELTLTYRSRGGAEMKTKKQYPVDARPEAVGYTPPLGPGETTSFVINLDDRPEGSTARPDVRVTGVALQNPQS